MVVWRPPSSPNLGPHRAAAIEIGARFGGVETAKLPEQMEDLLLRLHASEAKASGRWRGGQDGEGA